MVSVLDVAWYFVQKGTLQASVTQLKLQKLCYYAQGFYLAIYDEQLFPEHFEAWDQGPVAYELRVILRERKYQAIHPTEAAFGLPIASVVTTNFLDNIWYKFGHYEATALSKMTHRETPWIEASSLGRNTRLSLVTMKNYFTTRIGELPESTELDSCDDAIGIVYLKNGKTEHVPLSQIENYVEENNHLIESKRIKPERKRATSTSSRR
jgi:uncharacterized phage-associated protein